MLDRTATARGRFLEFHSSAVTLLSVGPILTKSKFATLAGVTPAAISQQISKGHLAVTPDDKIDANSPAAVAYLESKGVKPPGAPLRRGKKPGVKAKPKGPPPPPPGFEEDPDELAPGHVNDPYREVRDLEVDVSQIQEMPLREVVRRWGSVPRLMDYVKSVGGLEAIQDKRNKNDKYRKALVSRDGVVKTFEHVDNAHAVILADSPAKISMLVHSMLPDSDENPSKEEIEEIIRKEVSKALKAAKVKINKSLARMCGDPNDVGD